MALWISDLVIGISKDALLILYEFFMLVVGECALLNRFNSLSRLLLCRDLFCYRYFVFPYDSQRPPPPPGVLDVLEDNIFSCMSS